MSYFMDQYQRKKSINASISISKCTKDKDYIHILGSISTLALSSTLYFLNQLFTNALHFVPLEIIYHTGTTTFLPVYMLRMR